MDNGFLSRIEYGLYLLSARENGFDNGCIINTLCQVTSSPVKIMAAVNKDNKTCEMIKNTGEFNVSVLSQSAGYEIYKHFGLQSGKNTDKFFDFDGIERGKNGILYLKKGTNSYFGTSVINSIDTGTHIMFIAQPTEGAVLSDEKSATYEYYQNNVKPQFSDKRTGFRCKVCGYVYEGDFLPGDFVCPWCKHGADDFEKI